MWGAERDGDGIVTNEIEAFADDQLSSISGINYHKVLYYTLHIQIQQYGTLQ